MSIVNIPVSEISEEALRNLLEEYVSRDGTDYGVIEKDINEKTQLLLAQLNSGELMIFFDQESQQFDIGDRQMMKYFGVFE